MTLNFPIPSGMRTRAFVKGFTLIELLACIAVIAILAAVLLPSIKAVQSRAQSSKGLSNMRSLGSGILAYAADNSGAFPMQYWWSNGATPASLTSGSGANGLGFLAEGGYLGTFGGPEALRGKGRPDVLRCPRNSLSFENIQNWSSYVYKSPHSMGNGVTDESRNNISLFSPTMGVAVDMVQVFSGNPPAHDGSKTGVLYVDGHVELRPWRGNGLKSVETHPRYFDLKRDVN